MKGRSAKKSRSSKLKLRRPQGLNDGVRGVTNPPSPLSTQGDGTAGAVENAAPAAADLDFGNLYPSGPIKSMFRGKLKGEEVMAEWETDAENMLKDKHLRAKLMGKLIEQAGGIANMTSTMLSNANSIVSQEIMELSIMHKLEKTGHVRMNYKTGTLVTQPAVKDALMAIINSKRQSIKLFEEEIVRLSMDGRRPQGTDELPASYGDRSPEDVLVEFEQILTGRTRTPEEQLADYAKLKEAEARGDKQAIADILRPNVTPEQMDEHNKQQEATMRAKAKTEKAIYNPQIGSGDNGQ